MCGEQFQLNIDRSDVENVNKRLPFARAFSEKDSRGRNVNCTEVIVLNGLN